MVLRPDMQKLMDNIAIPRSAVERHTTDCSCAPHGLTEQKMCFGLFERVRFQFLTSLYELIFLLLMREASWKEPLFASVGPNVKCHVLSFGRGALSIARALALRLPAANVIAVVSKPGAMKRALRRIKQK